MSERIPPFDVEAEQAVLGCCLMSSKAIADTMPLLVPQDFYKPAHQFAWDAVTTLWRRGDPVDAVTLAGVLTDAGLFDDVGGAGFLLDLEANTPAISRAKTYADRVVHTSRLRAAISAASEVLDAVYDGRGPEEVLSLVGSLADDTRLLPRAITLPDTLTTVAEFLEWHAKQHPDEEGEWLIPGMLKLMHRVLMVAPEGSAKTTVLRQIAHALANGRHPFAAGTKIPPRRALIIDCENPDDAIADQVRLIDQMTGEAWSDSGNLHIWRVPEGLNLRASRADQARFETVLQEVRPELVVLGPVYKIYTNAGSGGMELEHSATELLRFIDACRVRFRFAILMEHHAPRGAKGDRELTPFGSVVWQRWPEFGIKLVPSEFDDHGHPHVLHIKRFRGDRVVTTWPVRLDRGTRSNPLPWVGEFPDGTWRHDRENTPQDVPPPSEEPF